MESNRGQNPNSHGNNPRIGERRFVTLSLDIWKFAQHIFGRYSPGIREMTTLAESVIQSNIENFCSENAIAYPSKNAIEAWLIYRHPHLKSNPKGCAEITKEICLGKTKFVDGYRCIRAIELDIRSFDNRNRLYERSHGGQLLSPSETMIDRESWLVTVQRLLRDIGIYRYANIQIIATREEKTERQGVESIVSVSEVRVQVMSENQQVQGCFSWEKIV